MTAQRTWRKSRYSSGQTDCVEVGSDLGALRDSKNPAGPTLTVSVDSFVAALKGGILSS